MKALLFLSLAACGSSYKTFHVAPDMRELAVDSAQHFNALFGCELVSVIENDVAPALGNHTQEIFFSEKMHPSFAGFTWLGGGPDEIDIMVRPKPTTFTLHVKEYPLTVPPNYVRTIVHELGHAYGLDHVDAPGEIMDPNAGDYHDEAAMARFKAALEAVGVRCK